jgi:hypothetical protein
MKSWPLGRASASGNGSGSGELGFGFGFGGAKEMLNFKEDEEDGEEESEQVMMRGSVRRGLTVREVLERNEDERWWREDSEAAVAIF